MEVISQGVTDVIILKERGLEKNLGQGTEENYQSTKDPIDSRGYKFNGRDRINSLLKIESPKEKDSPLPHQELEMPTKLSPTEKKLVYCRVPPWSRSQLIPEGMDKDP